MMEMRGGRWGRRKYKEYEREIWQIITAAFILITYFEYFILDTLTYIVPEVEKPPPLGVAMSNEQYGVIIAGTTVSFVIICSISGFFIDYFGAKTCILVSMYGMLMMGVLFTVSQSPYTTGLAYILMNGCEGVRWNAITKIIGNWYEEGKQGRAVSVLAIANPIAALISNMSIATLLDLGLNWRQINYIFCVVSFILYIFTIIFLKDTPPPNLSPPHTSSVIIKEEKEEEEMEEIQSNHLQYEQTISDLNSISDYQTTPNQHNVHHYHHHHHNNDDNTTTTITSPTPTPTPTPTYIEYNNEVNESKIDEIDTTRIIIMSAKDDDKNEDNEDVFDETERNDSETLEGGGIIILRTKYDLAKYLLRSSHFWLMIGFVIGSTFVDEFTGFINLFLSEALLVPTATAAEIVSINVIGMTIALLFGGILYDKLGFKGVSVFLVICVATSFLSIGVIAILLLTDLLNVTFASILFFIYGLSFTVPFYIPSSIYAVQFGGPYCSSVIGIFHSVGYSASILMDILAGSISWKFLFIIMTMSLGASTIIMFFFRLSIRNDITPRSQFARY